MKVLYVAGKYRDSRGIWYVSQNIAEAARVARELWLMGFAVICPHANTALMDGTDTDDTFLEGDIEILRRCDAVVALPNWRDSKGAVGELDYAAWHEKPVFFWPQDRARIEAFRTRGA